MWRMRVVHSTGYAYKSPVTASFNEALRWSAEIYHRLKGVLHERGLSGKRNLALREFALGHEALKRFVAREPLRRVHECVFAVLALESEPIDSRL